MGLGLDVFEGIVIAAPRPRLTEEEKRQRKRELDRRVRARARLEGTCYDCGARMSDEPEGTLRCKKCRKRRRDHEGLGPSQAPSEPPDPQPAIRCRESLQEAREHGVEFDEAWLVARGAALAAVRGDRDDREQLSVALFATEPEFRRCYERTGRPLKINRALIASSDSDVYIAYTVLG